jgi:uncharacterized membrane protein
MYALMIVLCITWGMISGLTFKNPIVALVIGAGGGFLIGQLFQYAGLV